jgi:acyl carrier protein
MNATREEILAIIENEGVSVDLAALKENALLTEAGIDSLEMMNVFLAIEEKFGVKIPDEDLDALSTIDGIVAYLQRL